MNRYLKLMIEIGYVIKFIHRSVCVCVCVCARAHTYVVIDS